MLVSPVVAALIVVGVGSALAAVFMGSSEGGAQNPHSPPQPGAPVPDHARTQQRVKLPAIGLIVLGILGVLISLYSFVAGNVDMQQLVDAGMPADQAESMVHWMNAGGVAMHVVSLLVAVFVTWAGFQMLKLKSWGAAVAANILVMVPCVTSCCCVLGIALGIWGLITLFNADVKRAFQGGSTPA